MIDKDKKYWELLGFANDEDTVGVDSGNAVFKLQAVNKIFSGNNTVNFASFTHAMTQISEADYKARMRHYRGNEQPYHVVKWKGEHFMIGEQAFSVNPGIEPLRGRAKMTRGYIGLMTMRGIVQLYNGKPPARINIMGMHPPGDHEFAPELKKSFVGKWSVEVGGESYNIEVAYVNAIDEIIGGVMNVSLGVDGAPMKESPIFGQGPTLVFDLGGGSLDLAQLHRNGAINYDAAMISHRIGVNQAITDAKNDFDRIHRNLVSDAEDGIPRQMIIDMMIDPTHSIEMLGEKIDCTEIYQDAANKVVAQCKRAITQYAGGINRFNRILTTGGGAGLFETEIRKAIFPSHDERGIIYRADSPRDMFKANVRGAVKMIPGFIQMGQKEASAYLRGKK